MSFMRVLLSLSCLWLLLLAVPVSGQQLTHQMTEEEKALMPAYLESQAIRLQTLPPPVPIRNISEFEPMEGVLIAYPLGIPVSLVRDMAEDVMVTTIVDSAAKEQQARSLYSSAGVNLANCNFLYAPHDSYWTRDYGPWFVTDGSEKISVINFIYNRPRPDDNNIPVEMAAFLGLDCYEMDLVHTGGNYMTDGWGISVSTDLVWDENAAKTHEEINQIMDDYLGVHTYHVTPDPQGEYIKHVDCWAKYLDVDKILIAEVPATDSRYSDYEAAAGYFANETSGYGNKYQVYRVYTPDDQPYTNSLILNKRVFVPTMNSAYDSTAIATYQAAMPGYTITGVSGDWVSTDAVHCRVKGIADRGMLYIKHLPLLEEQPQQGEYEITAEIVPYSGMPVVADSVKLYYRVDGGVYYPVDMTHTSGYAYTGSIPGQAQGSEIGYYIHAGDTSGRVSEHPLIGAPDPHEFTVAAPPQPPVADFTAAATTVIEGTSVQFTDLSTNNPTSWSWSFPGATPSASTDQHPAVIYYSQGTYTVTLTAANSVGSDTETKVDYITVLPAGACLGEVINPGFETGSTSGWIETGDVSVTTTAHSGSYGVSVNANGSGVEQEVTGLCPNTSYTVSAWGMAKANAGVVLGIKNYGGTDQTVQFTDSKNWQQRSITFTTGAADTSVTLFFAKTSTNKFGGSADDFELTLAN
jgi:agmatine deiminase